MTLNIQSQETTFLKTIKLNAKRNLDKPIVFEDSESITIALEKEEFINAIKNELSNLNSENKIFEAYANLLDYFKEIEYANSSTLQEKLLLKPFYYILSQLIQMECKLTINLNSNSLKTIDKYEKKISNSKEGMYESYFVYKSGQIILFQTLNYSIIE